jgi:hypothetical protein
LLQPRIRSSRLTHAIPLLIFCAAVVLSGILLPGAVNEDKRISIYSSAANYTLPVTTRDGHDYVGLFEVLEPLGTVSAKADGSRWKIQYNKTDGEFNNGKSRAKVHGKAIDLTANFVLDSGRGFSRGTSQFS